MASFMCFSPSKVDSKKSKGFSRSSNGSKKRSSKSKAPTKPITDVVNSSTHNSLKQHSLILSKSVPSLEKLIDNSLGSAESIVPAAYEDDETRSMKGDYSALNLHKSRNSQRLVSVFSAQSQRDDCLSDTHELVQMLDKKKNKPLESEKQWAAFSLQCSHMDRVSAWVDSLDDSSFFPVDAEEQHDEMEDEQTAGLHRLDSGESSCTDYSSTDEAAEANDFIQSLNSFSSVAHISSLGLKAIPSISAFVSLRSVNLSGNYIDHITPGFLPKSLHTLDLSRNKISNIDGLGDLEGLKILNLSHNRISRIGHGLSSCTLIKELYLAGNKISNVEGFDRLQKLTVLDLSFNRMTTVKALSQLAANFNSLLIFNLIGNPIQAHLGDDQLKKAVLSLLPRVAYLNKQPTDPRKIREITTNIVGRASIGEAARSSQRMMIRRSSQGLSSPAKCSAVDASFRTSKVRSKSRLSLSDKLQTH
ncbi:hypothetical protein KSP39_PZI003460 [Platanthera zijinensis]|uniref:Uncharacterized protein n=1 Tax=Platanthera zijinensis TaxID=2320716 RepID=A0AAP0GDB8_9ASPA